MAITPPEEGIALYITFAYVFPCLGVLISCLFSLSPIPRLKIISRDGKLRGTPCSLCMCLVLVPPMVRKRTRERE